MDPGSRRRILEYDAIRIAVIPVMDSARSARPAFLHSELGPGSCGAAGRGNLLTCREIATTRKTRSDDCWQKGFFVGKPAIGKHPHDLDVLFQRCTHVTLYGFVCPIVCIEFSTRFCPAFQKVHFQILPGFCDFLDRASLVFVLTPHFE